MKKEDEKTIPERAVNLMCDVGRQNIRAFNGGKSDEDLNLNNDFFQESIFYFYRDKIKGIKNFLSKFKK